MTLHRQVDSDLILAFPTPVVARKLHGVEALNRGLKAMILERMEAAPGDPGRSNVGGWRSGMDLLRWPHPEVGELMRHVARAVCRVTAVSMGVEDVTADVQAEAWANVLTSGAYNFPHTHPASLWSCVYYVDVGESGSVDDSGGTIEFIDPRIAVDMMRIPGNPFSGRLSFVPEDGMLILFPSWLYHHVHLYRGATPRISIAINVVGVDVVNG